MGSSVQQLDPSQQSEEAPEFEHAMGAKMVGQSEAVRAVVDTCQVFRAGLSAPGRPVGNLLFLGPTGSGKTRVKYVLGHSPCRH